MKLNRLAKGEKGQAIIIVVLLMLVSALVLAPMLSHVSSGLMSGKEVYEERMQLFYAADSGIEDGLWQVENEQLEECSFYPTDPTYDPYAYYDCDDDYEWHYDLPEDVNDKEINVALRNIWIPKDIAAPDPSTARDIIEGIGGESPTLVISGSVSATGTYQINIAYYYDDGVDPGGAGLEVDTVGIWLPPGFDYVDNSCSLLGEPYYNDPDPEGYCSGKAVVWDFGSTPLEDFPGSTGHPLERSFTFDFSGPSGVNPGAALSWIDTSGVDSVDYTWDADVKVYKVTSTATDDAFDPVKETVVEAYTAKSEIREMGTSISGDYRALGATLMIDGNHDGYYRDTLLSESDATVSDIPASSTVDAAYLYWSGWLVEGEDIIFSDNCSTFNNNWDPGSRWSVQGWGDKYFQGRGISGGAASKTLSMYIWNNPPLYGLDLSGYYGQEVTVSWEQSTNWRVDNTDTFYYAFSGDGGSSWSEDFEAFHGRYPPSDFSGTIPDEYLTSNFMMRFFMDFNRSDEYVYIDNIRITAAMETIADPGCTFEINGSPYHFDGDGDPVAGSGEITASLADQHYLANFTGSGVPNGYSYACKKDVTELVNFAGVTNGNATYTVGGVYGDVDNEWSYAAWSLIIIYSGPDIDRHQLYLYDDNFIYSGMNCNVDFDGDGIPGGIVSGFLAPEEITDAEHAARLTCFVGEGDNAYTGDRISVNDVYLSNSASPSNNVWNSASPGLAEDGIDIDTFEVSYPTIQPGDTSAEVDLPTGTDSWNLVYIIISFSSDVTSGGTISYLVRG